jgi:hypothetical protein
MEWIALSDIVDPYLYPRSASIKWARAETRTQRAFRLPVHRECRKSGWQRKSRRVGSGASTSCDTSGWRASERGLRDTGRSARVCTGGSNGAPMEGGYCGEEMPCGTPLGTGDGARICTGAAAVVSVGP